MVPLPGTHRHEVSEVHGERVGPLLAYLRHTSQRDSHRRERVCASVNEQGREGKGARDQWHVQGGSMKGELISAPSQGRTAMKVMLCKGSCRPEE